MDETLVFNILGTCISGIDVFINFLSYLNNSKNKSNQKLSDLLSLHNEIDLNIQVLSDILSEKTITKKRFIESAEKLSIDSWNQILFSGEGKKQRIIFQNKAKEREESLIFKLMNNTRKKMIEIKKQAKDSDYLENFKRKKIKQRFIALKENLIIVKALMDNI